MKKKSIALILAAALVGSILTGCGDSGTLAGNSGIGGGGSVAAGNYTIQKPPGPLYLSL